MTNLMLTTLVIGCLAAQGHAKTYQFEGVSVEVPEFGIKTGSVLNPPPAASKPYRDVEWVEIKGRTFRMGDDDEPSFSATVKNFKIAKTEVTAEQYARCLKAGSCRVEELGEKSSCNLDKQTQAPKAGRAKHPMNCVSWEGARQFAAFVVVGGRLPTEAEWELAASGDKRQRYPWGNQAPSCENAVIHEGGKGCGTGGTLDVGLKPAGANGLFDMGGNVREWTADWYGDYPMGSVDNPRGPERGSLRALRGGSFENSDAGFFLVGNRSVGAPGYPSSDVGFRPVRD